MTQRTTRRSAAAAALLGLALAVCAGCGSADRADGSAGVTAGSPYLACLQKHGVPLTPDGEEVDESAPSMTGDNPAARTACKGLVPPFTPDPGEVAHARKVTDCMRRSGFPDYPEPDASGDVHWSADAGQKFKDDPEAVAALRTCDPPPAGDGGSVRGG
jgi:hypothetical protein